MSNLPADVQELKFRDPKRAAALSAALARLAADLPGPITLMHVCGSHEQAIARYGLRSALPDGIRVSMGPGCPVCVTDMPEVDEAVALVRQGIHVATYGDMLRVPGSRMSLMDARAEGGQVHVVYGIEQAVDVARRTDAEVVFFATGFETTAVTTASALLRTPPPNFSVLSAHKFILPAMEIVVQVPGTAIAGFIAAGHAATITGSAIFEPFADRYRQPVVVAGFEPLDILAALLRLVELVRDGEPRVVNMFPRCVTPQGNLRAQAQLWQVFELTSGHWRGIAEIPGGNMRLRPEWAHYDARRRFTIDLTLLRDGLPPSLVEQCVCGRIMTGLASPVNCPLFGDTCTPEMPVGACMVSSEGACRIWHEYGEHEGHEGYKGREEHKRHKEYEARSGHGADAGARS